MPNKSRSIHQKSFKVQKTLLWALFELHCSFCTSPSCVTTTHHELCVSKSMLRHHMEPSLSDWAYCRLIARRYRECDNFNVAYPLAYGFRSWVKQRQSYKHRGLQDPNNCDFGWRGSFALLYVLAWRYFAGRSARQRWCRRVLDYCQTQYSWQRRKDQDWHDTSHCHKWGPSKFGNERQFTDCQNKSKKLELSNWLWAAYFDVLTKNLAGKLWCQSKPAKETARIIVQSLLCERSTRTSDGICFVGKKIDHRFWYLRWWVWYRYSGRMYTNGPSRLFQWNAAALLDDLFWRWSLCHSYWSYLARRILA